VQKCIGIKVQLGDKGLVVWKQQRLCRNI